MANGPRLATTRRTGWDTPERSAVQERFYRELMAVDRLPSAPEIAQRLLVAVNREDAHVSELTRLIGRDQSLVARLLRLANSAFFSVRTRVTSVEQATMLLGFARVATSRSASRCGASSRGRARRPAAGESRSGAT